jgi:DNA-directed RNA polymerase subunit RPC12/RpoP
MNDPATVATEYVWPKCVACRRDLWENEYERQACRPCEDRAAGQLAEIGPLFARLDTTAALVRGSRRTSAAPSGSRTPPLPVSLAVLNLAAVGGVATRLLAIEDSWRQALGWSLAPEVRPLTRVVGEGLKFLRNNLLWACSSYESVADDLEEIRRLHAEATAALSPDPRPGRVKIGSCPVVCEDGLPCRTPLTVTTANSRIRCGGCGSRWDDLDAWRQLRQAQEALLREEAGVAA